MPTTLEIPFPPRPLPHTGTPLDPPLIWVEPRWEYHHVVRHLETEAPLSEAELDTLGTDHWELTGVVPLGDTMHYYFKRAAHP